MAAGLVLIMVGVVAGGWWLVLAAFGLLPLAAGLFDVCVLGALFRLPFGGRAFCAGVPLMQSPADLVSSVLVDRTSDRTVLLLDS